MTDEKQAKSAEKSAGSKKSTEPDTWVRESIRVDERVWRQIKITAMTNGQTISQILGVLMADYVKKQK